jgi:hypothetical protein
LRLLAAYIVNSTLSIATSPVGFSLNSNVKLSTFDRSTS